MVGSSRSIRIICSTATRRPGGCPRWPGLLSCRSWAEGRHEPGEARSDLLGVWCVEHARLLRVLAVPASGLEPVSRAPETASPSAGLTAAAPPAVDGRG